MNNKESYRKICRRENIPLFAQDWWLDAVTLSDGKDWDAIVVCEKGEPVAAMPYHYVSKLGFKFILMPQQTQHTYCWCKNPELFPRVIKELDKTIKGRTLGAYLQLYLTEEQKHYLQADGWDIKERTTYVIEHPDKSDSLVKRFSESKRQEVRKAEGKFTLRTSMGPSDLYEFHKKSLSQRGLKILYSKSLLDSIYDEATERGQCVVLSAANADGVTCAATLLVWDKERLYYLISSYDSDHKKSGVTAYIITEAIKFAAERSLAFDFEGGTSPSIAMSYSQFGSAKQNYYGILKAHLPLTAIFRKFF